MKDDFAVKGDVIDALMTITKPGSEENIVDAHMVEAVDVNDGVADLTLMVDPSLDREARFALEDTIYDKLEAIDGVNEVKIKSMTPEALRRDQSGESAPAASSAPKAAGAGVGAASAAPGSAAQGAKQPSVPAAAPVAGVGKVIAVASGKGGVGKSTVAINLALALKALDYRVGLLDIDIYGPSLPTLLGISDRPGVSNRQIVPIDVDGLRVMSLGFLMEDDTPVIWRGPIVTGIIRQFLRDVDWSGLDYLIVDMPPGTGDAQLALAQTVPVDGAVVVTTPSELALVDAARGLQMFKTLNIDVLGVVSNMSRFISPETGTAHYIFGEGTVEREAERLGTSVIGDIPLDMEVRAGGDRGEPIVSAQPDSEITAHFLALGRRVAELAPLGGSGDEAPKKKGLFSFLKS